MAILNRSLRDASDAHPGWFRLQAHSSGREPYRSAGARPANRPLGVSPSHRRDRTVAEMLRTSYSLGTALVSVDTSRDFDALKALRLIAHGMRLEASSRSRSR